MLESLPHPIRATNRKGMEMNRESSRQLHFFKVFSKYHYDILLTESEESAISEYSTKHKEPIDSLSCVYANSVEREWYCFHQTKEYEQLKKYRR